MYRKAHVNAFDFALSVLFSVSLSSLIWQEFTLKGIFLWVPCILIGEVFVHLRYRLSLPCPHCGFDPSLYYRDRDLAVARIQRHLKNRKNDPRYLLAEPLRLPKKIGRPVKSLLKAHFEDEKLGAVEKALDSTAGSLEVEPQPR